MRPWIIFLILALCSCTHSMQRFKSEGFEVLSFEKDFINSYLVRLNSKKFLMIDAGAADDAEKLDEAMMASGINPQDIAAIAITHGHWDHAGGAKYFQEKYKMPVIAGLGDKGIIENGEAGSVCPVGFIAKIRADLDAHHQFSPPKIDFWIEEDTDLKSIIPGLQGRILTVPSHTPGSLAIVLGEHIFVGDLFRGSLLGNQPTTHFYICDIEENKDYIRSLASQPAYKYFYIGHFGPRFSTETITNTW